MQPMNYHLRRVELHLRKIQATRARTATEENPCELEQTVKDAAQLLVQEANDVLELACQDLNECLNG